MKNIDNENVFNLKHSQIKKKPHESHTKVDTAPENINGSTFGGSSLSEAIGRSQVNHNLKNDSLENDVKLFVEHPKCVESSNKFFDLAYDKYQNSVDAPYEYSAVLAKTYYDMLNGENSI